LYTYKGQHLISYILCDGKEVYEVKLGAMAVVEKCFGIVYGGTE
jgi:hypothetical protein